MTKNLDSQAISPDQVVGVVSALIRAEHRHAAYMARSLHLPAADSLALYHLANEPLSASALGERLGLTSGSVTALVDRLIRKGFVQRHAHETDRRVVLVEMTKQGHEAAWNVVQYFVRDTFALCGELSAVERKTIERFLQKLVTVIDADTDRQQRHDR
jgi:DNA-binding MarR family transcriptional regulator